MPRSTFQRNRRADTITGVARLNGLNVRQLSAKTGIPLMTLYKRLREPLTMTLGEFEAIDKVLCFDENQMSTVVRG